MTLGELVGAGRKLVREARKGTLPHQLDGLDRDTDQTDPIPLTFPSRLPPPPRKPKLGPLKMR